LGRGEEGEENEEQEAAREEEEWRSQGLSGKEGRRLLTK